MAVAKPTKTESPNTAIESGALKPLGALAKTLS
jgi:hypothetical protein